MNVEPLREVAGKIAIVTGAARGLGKGTAEALGRRRDSRGGF